MYTTLFLTAYYGLFRVSELTVTASNHAVKAKDIQIGYNKKKFMIILRSSKMHGAESQPQIVKISSKQGIQSNSTTTRKQNTTEISLPCPYLALREFATARVPFASDEDKFFVFRDGTSVSALNMRNCLKFTLKSAGFDNRLYSLHSIRSGRAGDLL